MNPDAVIKMARDAIKGHLKAFAASSASAKKGTKGKKGGCGNSNKSASAMGGSSGGNIIAQFVAAANKIGMA